MDPMTIAYVLAAAGGVFTIGGLLSPRSASAAPGAYGSGGGQTVVVPSGGGSSASSGTPPRDPYTRQLQEAINAYARTFPGVVSEYPIDVDGWFGPQTNDAYLQVAAHASRRGRLLPGVEKIRTAAPSDFGNVWTNIDGGQVGVAVSNMAKVMQNKG